MRHLGDITKLKGTTVEPVNVVIGGSPCQDLSIAGRREGLAGERSGLFMEQIRLIKEMRDADIHRGRSGKDVRPRFMVWENVPGAFSSNKGKDFAAVLEETVRVVLEEAPDIPVPKNGWPTAGCISVGGDRPVSVAYRVFDSQFWGVPQRRRRIALVADFAGGCAPEILFEREGMQGDHQAGRETWERITGHAQTGSERDDRVLGGDAYTLKIRSGCEGGGKGALIQKDLSATLSTLQDQTLFQPTGNYTPWDVQSRQIIDEDGIWPSLYAGEGGGRGYVLRKQGDVVALEGNGQHPSHKGDGYSEDGVSYTLNTIERHGVAYAVHENQRNECRLSDTAHTLNTGGGRPGQGNPVILVDPVGEQEPVVYNGENLTHPLNRQNPVPGDPCHTLGTDTRNYLVQAVQDSCILDDQGGQQISVRTDGKVPTLRAEAHGNLPCVVESYGVTTKGNGDAFINPETHTTLSTGGGQAGQGYPCVMQSAGFKPQQGSKAHGMGFAMEQAPTIIAGANEGVVIRFDQAPTAYSFDSLASNSMKSKNPHSGCREVDIAKTLDTSDPNPSKNQGGIAVVQAYSVENHPGDGRMRIDESGKAQTLTERMGTGGGNVPMVMFENHSQDSRYTGPLDVAQPVTATYGMGGNNQPFVIEEKPICMATQQGGAEIMEDKCPTSTAAAGMSGNNQPVVTVPIHDKATRHMGKHGDKHDGAGNGLGVGSDGDPMYTLTSGDHHAICTDVGFFASTEDVSTTLLARMYKDPPLVSFKETYQDKAGTLCTSYPNKISHQDVIPNLYVTGQIGTHYIVRRLTPLECERLQGFPDGWTDIGDWTDGKGKTRKGDSDAPRYKALGNSIALPPWCYVLTRLSLVCGGEQTMGSLFDGIGGFPIIWETINGKGTCLWASEIEEFPIAVTQKRFNGEEQT